MADDREIPRHKWVLRQLATIGFFLLAVNNIASWARYLMGDHLGLPWPLYPIGGALFLWMAVMRLIEDEVGTRKRTKEDA